MYNVEKLEQQWIRYRRKKLLFPIVIVSTLLVVASASVYYLGNNNIFSEHNMTTVSSSKQAAAMDKKEIKDTHVLSKNLSTEVPSLQKRIQHSNSKVGQIIFQDDTAAVPGKIKKRKNLLIQVTERGSKDIAADIENRFEFAKDKSDSLFLAKYYYDKKEYIKAEKWALETNKLDNTIEESWLIFAKSKAKQGKRIEALKVLKAFLDQSSSVKAKILIDKIRRGKNF